MQCEICGSEAQLYIVEVEGSKLRVCKSCAKFGKLIAPLKSTSKPPVKKKIEVTKPIEIIVADYSKRIKRAREALNLKQEDFAKKINEKLSLIHKIETGAITPHIKLAKKIEQFLKIRLVEVYEESYIPKKSKKELKLTVGDLVKIKKR